jgi:hypothetical protein
VRRLAKASSAGSDTRQGSRLALIAALVLAAALTLGATFAGATAPTATIENATAVEYTTAHVAGEVNPEGKFTEWRFQYITDAAFQAHADARQRLTVSATAGTYTLAFQGQTTAPIAFDATASQVETELNALSTIGGAGGSVAVSGGPGDEAGSSPYTIDFAGSLAEANLETIGSDSSGLSGGNASASVETTISGRHPGFEGAETGPAGSLETGAEPVGGDLAGLTPATIYHLRLLASNEDGEAKPEAAAFETKAVAKPTVTIEPVTTFTDSTAHFVGHVNVNAPALPASEAEQIAYENAYRTEWHFECVAPGPACGGTLSGEVKADSSHEFPAGPVEVTGDAAGLNPHKSYTVKLVATNAGGTEEQSAAPFSTAGIPPTLTGEIPSIPRSDHEVTVRAIVNPHNSALTTCRFDYGLTTAYGQSASCKGATPEDNEGHTVEADLSGLQSDSTYHFQFVGGNGVGANLQTGDAEFQTLAEESSEPCSNEPIRVEQQSEFLPDCRAYEQVSPVDKNGANIIRYSPSTRTSVDGDAASYAALTAFGDVHGTGLSSEYLSSRTPTGWSTHGITPLVGPTTIQIVATTTAYYPGDLSSNLDRGVFASPMPITDSSPVRGVSNLYLRDDLLEPGPGDYQLITACPLCEEQPGQTMLGPRTGNAGLDVRFVPALAGASPDLGHIAFESIYNLTANASPQPATCGTAHAFFPPPSPLFCNQRLYEWDHGALRLAGVLPDGTPADISEAGASALGSVRAPHVVSDGSDGHSRVFFLQPTDSFGHTASELGEGFPALEVVSAEEGNLFMRLDGTSTVQLNLSERTDCGSEAAGEAPKNPPACSGTPDPDEFSPVAYLDASTDGRRVFFMTTQALTDDATPGNNHQIYMYDDSQPASDPHNLTLLNPDKEPTDGSDAAGMIGVSEDGQYAYFISANQILAGHHLLNSESVIDLWHNGKVTEVSTVSGGIRENLLAGTAAQINMHQARLTPDGKHLLYSTFGQGSPRMGPTGYDHGHCTNEFGNGCRELYVYSADTPEIQCASCRPDGAPAKFFDENQQLSMASAFTERESGAAHSTEHLNRALSADGHYVFFSTAEPLVPRDTDGAVDAYRYDTQTGQTSLVSSGTDGNGSWFLEASEDGEDVFFISSEALAGYDTDSAYDLYDARSGGGFPEPVPHPSICTGESCQGSGAPAPPSPLIGSDNEGRGNESTVRRCPKGTQRVKARGRTRCIRRKAKLHSQRKAASDRRTVK